MSWNFSTLPAMFQDTVWNAFGKPCRMFSCSTRNPKILRDLYTQQMVQFDEEHHFGAISIDSTSRTNRINIGDEIQTIAGIQFLRHFWTSF